MCLTPNLFLILGEPNSLVKVRSYGGEKLIDFLF